MDNTTGVTEKDINAVKGRIIDLFFWLYAVFMWFALSTSIYRAVDTGIQAAHYAQAALVLLFLALFLFRRKMSIKTKIYSVIIITFLLAVGGLLSFGLLSTGMYFLFVFVILSVFLLGVRQGVYSFGFAFVFFIVVAYLHQQSIIRFVPENPNFYNSISAWLMAIMVFSLASLIIIFFWKEMYGFLIQKVKITSNNDEQLVKINKLLSREIESRKSTDKKLAQQFEESTAINDEYQLVNKELVGMNDKLESTNLLLQEANEKSKAAESLKSAFLNNMSHEVRTPLNAIVGFTTLLSNDELKPTERNKYLEIIQASTTNLLGVISDLVTVAKIQSNQYNVDFVEFNINDLLDEISERYTREIFINKEDKVEFGIDNQMPSSSILKSDLECIKIIINKLLDNAIKFTHSGSIKLICHIEDENLLKIIVEDTGIGIPKDKSQQIFETFNQANPTETRKYGGTGLGLSIVKGLTELLAGSVSFTTQAKQGTIFTIAIPVLSSKSLSVK